ncbi:hypothetical protein SGPA1_30681 [Streptomyces misionensis JCM 4497]
MHARGTLPGAPGCSRLVPPWSAYAAGSALNPRQTLQGQEPCRCQWPGLYCLGVRLAVRPRRGIGANHHITEQKEDRERPRPCRYRDPRRLRRHHPCRQPCGHPLRSRSRRLRLRRPCRRLHGGSRLGTSGPRP